MIRILITGKNSYVGTSLKKYLMTKYPTIYTIDEISVRDEEWKTYDFSAYDVIFHVAGIAHVSTDPRLEDQYYKVNRDLTISVAKKAKNDNVKHFIFMSSMIVFGNPKDGKVGLHTPPKPVNFYGKSKLQAEEGIRKLDCENFKVSILRPPMIYGPNSKGNYPRLSKLARITPVFPDYPNKRSMLFVDNLSAFIKEIIDLKESGTFHPQNNDYVKTSQLVKDIAQVQNRRVRFTKIFNPLITLAKKITLVSKIFGDLYYVDKVDNPDQIGFSETIHITEKGKKS